MRLATFNILHGRSPSDGLVDLTRLADAVRTLDPDILGLQEVDRLQHRSQLADLTAVAADAMNAPYHRFAAALSGTPGATWIAATGTELPETAAFGVALLSRYPARNWQVLRLPRIPVKFPMYLRAARKLITVHEEPRSVVIGELDTPAGPLVVANTHLSFVPGWGRRQLVRVRKDLSAFHEPVVLMGDLNMSAPKPAAVTGYRSLAEHPTFPVGRPTQQLDHILMRGSLGSVVSGSAPALSLSDHRALVVDLELGVS
jgi:endonuclease/exonuclease/phosphatase family metal-dependent hydrolase